MIRVDGEFGFYINFNAWRGCWIVVSEVDRKHHYVPQWYQKKFLMGNVHKYYYLDLLPKPSRDKNHRECRDRSGRLMYPRNPQLRAPESCFFSWNLYRKYTEKGFSDYLEDRFYGGLDNACARLWPDIKDRKFDWKALAGILHFMCALSMRTPKGLDQLATLVLRARPDFPYTTRAHALEGVEPHMRFMVSNWCDTVWEVVSAETASVKFIVSDNPVTYYHSSFDPLSWVCRYPEDPSPLLIGTRTLLPIDMNRCLILTNKEALLTKRLHTNYKKHILSPEASGLVAIDRVVYGRDLEQSEVLAINYIIKKRAKKYIAAAKEDWLYPERYMQTRVWRSLLPALVPCMSEELSKDLARYRIEIDALPAKTLRTMPARISKRKARPDKWRGLPP